MIVNHIVVATKNNKYIFKILQMSFTTITKSIFYIDF